MINQRSTISPENSALDRMEKLIAELDGESGTFNALMREHLETARFYLLGSMPEEYALNLGLAKELLPNLDDDDLKIRIADFIQSQQALQS